MAIVLQLLWLNPLAFFIVAGILIISLSIHEFAHALVADRLGDPTPRSQGRLTLNPLAHLDWLGTLLLFTIGFGWGKPVVVDAYNLRSPRRDMTLVALAGPTSNLLCALVMAFLAAHLFNGGWLAAALSLAVQMNIMLAVFNLLPVGPLDGSRVLAGLLPKNLAYEYEMVMQRYGIYILLLLIFPFVQGQSALDYLIQPLQEFFTTIILRLVG
jgi:Zn-dependent protease